MSDEGMERGRVQREKRKTVPQQLVSTAYELNDRVLSSRKGSGASVEALVQ